jgi:hypothetical protein
MIISVHYFACRLKIIIYDGERNKLEAVEAARDTWTRSYHERKSWIKGTASKEYINLVQYGTYR